MSNDECPHYTVIRIKTVVEPTDPIATPRVCLKCGASFLLYPLNLKDYPELEEMLKEFAKEATQNIPKL